MIGHRDDRGLRRRLGSLAGAVVLLLAGLALLGTPAHAEEAHALVRTIVGSEIPQGEFGLILGVAADNSNGPSNGDVYVYERSLSNGEGLIDKFDGEGKYVGIQITGAETPQGSLLPLNNLSAGRFSGIAVDDSSSPNKGDIYVSDIKHDVVDKFNEAGQYQCQITGKTPANPQEEANECNGAAGSETPNGGFEPTGVVVDSSGDVYVSDHSNDVIDEFSPSGAYLGQISDPSIVRAGALSIAPDDDIYMLNFGEDIVKFSAAGAFLSSFDELEPVSEESAKPTAMTVDPVNGHVYAVAENPNPSYIQEFGENDELLGTLGSEQLGDGSKKHALGLAVSDSTGDLLAAEELTQPGGAVYVFSPDLPPGPPEIKSESSWNTKATSSEVRAEIDPFDLATTCQVQYVDEEQFTASGYEAATTVNCSPESFEPSFASSTASALLTGLHVDSTYHYRFIVANSAAPKGVVGADETFSTFGIQSFSIGAFGPAAEVDALAGSHPYELTTAFVLPTTNVPNKEAAAEGNPHDVEVELPPGLIGNPDAVSKCAPYNVAHADCSGASQVGVLKLTTAGGLSTESPIYNLVPPAGIAAQFGARFNGFVTAHIDAKIRTGGDYGVTADSFYVSSAEGLTGATVTLWGVPSDPRHDAERYCPAAGKINEEAPCSERGPSIPFLSNPTSCTSSHATSIRIDTWQEPDTFVSSRGEMPSMTECDRVPFEPSIAIAPTTSTAESPSGLHVDLHVPQNNNPVGRAEANLRTATVTLPQGVTVNPSEANGLEACSPSQIELDGPEPAKCPSGSEIGSVEVDTPLLEHPLRGALYVATQDENPFKSLLALYIAVYDPQTGVVVKLAGKVTPDPVTGQLTTTFSENPQLPFEDLKLDLFGGERGALISPPTCGSYEATSLLEPFSHQPAAGEAAGTPDAQLSSEFEINSRCTSGFSPSFVAGTQSSSAAGFSQFTMTLARNDGEQRLSTVAVRMPPGVAGMISKVPLCGEAQANAGSCPAASEIGHVTVQAGAGAQPVTLPQAGKPQDPVYLTGPYKGAPFGLSIVVPAEAGPFNLDENGHPVVVRASIAVDPHTGQVSVQSEPAPTILQGIPVDLRTINVTIDRPGFIFNPTNCKPLNVTGTITSTQGSLAAVSSHFQVANCSALSFKPTFKAETHANHTRRKGSYLKVTITSRQGEANLAKVDVTLPKKLPADLATLKEACSAAQFAKNPAGCPKSAVVGSVVVHTPVLSKALTGPAIYVSHGGARFPNLALVLEGEGVTIIQEGNTNISKGFTSSSFNAIPDLPVSSVELMLPEGEKPALGGNGGNLCTKTVTKRVKLKVHGRAVYRKRHVKQRLTLYMPTTITGQNGAVMRQKTKVGVRGCR